MIARLQIIGASAVVALAVAPIGYVAGRAAGAASVEAKFLEQRQALELRLAAFEVKAANDAAAIVALEGEAARLGERLEAEAYGDGDAARPALGVDSVRRVFSR
jgi:hypothetical protein